MYKTRIQPDNNRCYIQNVLICISNEDYIGKFFVIRTKYVKTVRAPCRLL
jgi:hypothetical protein